MPALPAIRSTFLAIAATALVAPMLTAPAQAVEQFAGEASSVKTVTRSYGDRVVRQDDRDQRLRINFKGKRGDLVALRSYPNDGDPGCERTALRRLDNGRRVTQKVADLWRLPSGGNFTVTYRQDCYSHPGGDEGGNGEYLASVQLMKAVMHPLVPNGPSVDLPVGDGYLHVAELELTDARAVTVEGFTTSDQPVSGWWGQVLVPTSMAPRTGPADTLDSDSCFPSSPVVVQAGKAILHTPPTSAGGKAPAPLTCPAEVAAYTPKVGDKIMFFDARQPKRATAVWAP